MNGKLFLACTLIPAALFAAHPIIPGFERIHGSGGLPAEGGQLLLGELNCTACHSPGAEAKAALTNRQAPILTSVTSRVKAPYLKAFLADPQAVKPGTLMPKLFNDGDEDKIDAIIAYLHSIENDTPPPPAIHGNTMKKGEQLFKEMGCIACHSDRTGSGKKLTEGSGYEVPSVPLGDLGQKYTVEGLARFLSDPLAIRPSGRMPSFRLEAKDAGTLAAYLTNERPSKTASAGGAAPAEKGNNVSFRYVITKGELPKDFSKVPAKEEGTLGGIVLKRAWKGNNFAVEFKSYFYAEHAGKYDFSTKSDDGSFVYINEKKVVSNGGIHPDNKEVKGSINLERGFHALRVTYNEVAGNQSIALFVRGPKLAHQHVPARLLSTNKTPPPVANETAQVEEKAPDTALIAKGAKLYRSMGCASCHTAKENGKIVKSTVKAKPLASLSASTRGCQAATGAGPHYSLSKTQTTALAAALKSLRNIPKPTADSRIKQTMTAMNCYACHERGGIGGPGQNRIQHFKSTEDDMGPEGNLPPGLSGVGAKLRPEVLKDILTNAKIKPEKWPRHYVKVKMPYFGKNNIQHLLKDLPDADAYQPDPEPPKTVSIAAGRQLTGTKGMGCVTCHTYAGNKALGIQGPELSDMPSRLTKSWFKRWLLAPQSIRETTRMPSFWPAGKSVNPHILGGDTNKQIDAIWAFLGAPANGRPPEGINAKNYIALEASERPTIYRNFYGKAPSRGIGIAYPEGVNLLFDANYMRLVQVWRGEFVNAGIHWIARGQGAANPTGEQVVDLFHADPFAIIAKDEAWPSRAEAKGDLPGRKSATRFKGYTLDKQGRPTFKYTYRDITITETYEPIEKDGRNIILRTLTLQSKKPLDGLHFFGARGKSITKKSDGVYQVNADTTLAFELENWQEPEVRPNQSGFDMVIPIKPGLTSAKLTETINW